MLGRNRTGVSAQESREADDRLAYAVAEALDGAVRSETRVPPADMMGSLEDGSTDGMDSMDLEAIESFDASSMVGMSGITITYPKPDKGDGSASA